MNKVKELRKKQRISQAELARMAGISRPHLSHVECGAAMPSIQVAKAIAGALQCTVDEVFGGVLVSSA